MESEKNLGVLAGLRFFLMSYNLKALCTSLRKLMLFQTYPSPQSKFDNDNDKDTIVVVVVVDGGDLLLLMMKMFLL